MTTDKIMRGDVREFIERDGTKKGKLCLILSNEDRGYDNIQSILIFSKSTRYHRDRVETTVLGEPMFVRCGLVTYVKRDCIGDYVDTLSEADMKKVTSQILYELGIPDYESRYEELLQVCANAS